MSPCLFCGGDARRAVYVCRHLQPRRAAVVIDGGPWGAQRGDDEPPVPTDAEWVDRIAHPGAILNPVNPVTDRLWTHRGEK